jgi:hypothetical protein
MPAILPETSEFQTPVYGTVFANRSAVLRRLTPGAALILVPDPPGIDDPTVWVHAAGGDVIGHLSPDLSSWLVPWMLAGHSCRAVVARVGGADVASWKRLIIDVRCERRVTRGSAPVSSQPS